MISPPSPVPEAAGEAFIRQMQMLIEVVGKPTAGALANQSKRRNKAAHPRTGGDPLRKSTIEDYLNWKRRRLPPWPLVRELLLTCRFLVRTDNIPFSEELLGTETEWWELWIAARRGEVPRGSPIQLAKLGLRAIYVPPAAMRFARVSGREGDSRHLLTSHNSGTPTVAPSHTEDATPTAHESAAATAPPQDVPASSSQERQAALGPLRVVLAPELAEGGGWVNVTRWRVQTGDHVSEGDPLVEVVNEQELDFLLTVPYDGVVREILVSEDNQVAANHGLCTIQGY
jgi:biotin carboxyl carrier protein